MRLPKVHLTKQADLWCTSHLLISLPSKATCSGSEGRLTRIRIHPTPGRQVISYYWTVWPEELFAATCSVENEFGSDTYVFTGSKTQKQALQNKWDPQLLRHLPAAKAVLGRNTWNCCKGKMSHRSNQVSHRFVHVHSPALETPPPLNSASSTSQNVLPLSQSLPTSIPNNGIFKMCVIVFYWTKVFLGMY